MRRALLVLALGACATPPPPGPAAPSAPVPEPAPAPAPAESAAAVAPVAPVAAPSEKLAPPPPPAPAAREVSLLRWTHPVEVPVVSLGIGKRRVAALAVDAPGKPTAVWMRDGTRWRSLELPGELRPRANEEDTMRVFFGRDDRPRLMGWRDHGDHLSQRYYRWKGNWRGKAGEIGRLDADPPAALFGILGHDDPEVVCKLDDICIIKRLTGWTMVPVPPRIHAVEIVDEKAYAVAKGSALHIGKKDDRWKPLSASVPWDDAIALWPFADGTVWVTDGERLFHWNGSAWSDEPSPVKGPTKLWGRSPDDLWLVGEGGVAHRDGDGWARTKSPQGAFVDVIGAEDEVFVAGPDGVWRGVAP